MCPMSVPWGQGQGQGDICGVCKTSQSCLTPRAREEPGKGVKAALAQAIPIPAAGLPEKLPLWAEQMEQKGQNPARTLNSAVVWGGQQGHAAH